MRELTLSTTANEPVFMADSADHLTGKTGLTLTITASKDGGAFASITPTVTDLGSGWYNLAFTTTHTNTLGALAVHISATGADPTDFKCLVVAVNKADAVRMGLSALPNANAEASGGLPTLSAAQASNGTIQANVHRWLTGTPNALQSGRIDSYLGAVAAGVIAAASFAANALDAVWSTAIRVLTAGTNIALAKGTGVTGFNDIAAGAAMTLTSGERTAIANAVEAEIIDETDSEKVLTAITDKIAAVNPDLGGLTVAAIASAVWSAVTRTLTAGTNIVLAKGVGVTGFNDLSAAQVNAEVDTALADYDAPTNAEMVARTLPSASYALSTQVDGVEVVTDKLNTAMELDGAVYRFTVNALEMAPAGGGGGGGATAEEVRIEMDSNSTRLAAIEAKTNLITAGAITVSSPVTQTGNKITLHRGVTLVIPLLGLGSLIGREKLYFTVKAALGDGDTQALIQIEETLGLVRLVGAAGTLADGSLTVDDAALGNITVRLAAAAAAKLRPAVDLFYDVKKVESGDVEAPVQGTLDIEGDVTRAVA